MSGQAQKRLGISPLSQEQETIHPEIILHHGRNGRFGKLFSDILAQEGRVAPDTRTLALGNLHCQGYFIGNLFQNHGGQLREVLDHGSYASLSTVTVSACGTSTALSCT